MFEKVTLNQVRVYTNRCPHCFDHTSSMGNTVHVIEEPSDLDAGKEG
jgi:hypothetical protein